MSTDNKEIIYKEYLTGRDVQEIEDCLYSGMEVGTDGTPKGFDPKVITKRLNKAIELLVVSVGGETDKILDRVLDLPKDQYLSVKAKISEMAELEEKKS